MRSIWRGTSGKFASEWVATCCGDGLSCALSQRLVTFFNIIKDEIVKYITVLPIIGVGV